MTIATQEQLLALDWPHQGLPLAPARAKSSLGSDFTYAGLPFILLHAGSGSAAPAPIPLLHLGLAHSDAPDSAVTLGRETGDVLLLDDGFTLIEEDETLDSGLATIELFQGSTPTGGTWVVGTDYRTNKPTDGVLRSPYPSGTDADESATLTVVTTAPNTRISFEWGVVGLYWGWDPLGSDQLRFYVNDVEKLVAYPTTPGPGSQADWAQGLYTLVLPPGTYNLRWRWQRPEYRQSFLNSAHAWITALLIDPNF